MKRPAASSRPAFMKKPAAASSSTSPKAKDNPKPKPKPAPKKQAQRNSKGPITRQMRLKKKPQGCSKCRYVRGCCDSCWLQRGYRVV